jgi:hypothetical protein
MEKPHKKLDVWQIAMKTTKMVYESTKGFPEEEKFGLCFTNHKCVEPQSASHAISPRGLQDKGKKSLRIFSV